MTLFYGMFSGKKFTWTVFLLHALVWAVVFSLPLVLSPDTAFVRLPWRLVIFLYGVRYAAWVALFYLNASLLVPRYIFRARYLQFAVIQLLLIAGVYFVHPAFLRAAGGDQFTVSSPVSFFVSQYLFILACSTAYALIRQKVVADHEREKENFKTELSFLRSQINPHFIFNVLNGMVSLARKQSDLLEPAILKFSSMMRYMVYETNEGRKPLIREIEYLESYIELQQMRFGKNVAIRCSLQKEGIDYSVEPMLLMPLVENAFKHGAISGKDAAIDIMLTVRKGVLLFSVKNSCDRCMDAVRMKGIGLNNLDRRLQLLYKGNHTLNILCHEGWFTASLELNLS